MDQSINQLTGMRPFSSFRFDAEHLFTAGYILKRGCSSKTSKGCWDDFHELVCTSVCYEGRLENL